MKMSRIGDTGERLPGWRCGLGGKAEGKRGGGGRTDGGERH